MNNNWFKNYNLAKAYYEEHGNLEMLQKYESNDGTKLGLWISTQKKAYKNRTIPQNQRTNTFKPLTDEQVSLLESIGMKWQSREKNTRTWEYMYELARTYYEEHGNLEIPQKYKSNDGTKLGLWISTQRQAYKNRTIPQNQRTNFFKPLTDEQVRLLESIGMRFESKIKPWEEIYKLAKAYYEKYGNLEIPKKYESEDGTKLGLWVRTQREAYKNRTIPRNQRTNTFKPLTDEQVSLLESIGMKWLLKEKKTKTWEYMYELAKAYYEKYGNLEIPCNYVNKDNINLGLWIYHQRQVYKNRTIPKEMRTSNTKPLIDEKIKLLESIGMRFESKIKPWEEIYKLAKAYYEKYGNLEIPSTYISTDGTKLGTWIHHQRQAYKNRTIPKEMRTSNIKSLTDEQVILLESIGMKWELKNRNIQTTKITKTKQLKLEKMFLQFLNTYIKEHKNEIKSYEDVRKIEEEFLKVLENKYKEPGKQKTK